MSPVAFVGLSHLGQVYSACWQQRGIEVVGIHPGALPDTVPEPDLPPPAPRSGFPTLRFCELIIVSLDIWDTAPASVDAVRNLIDQITPYVSAKSTVVILSQAPVGFTRSLDLKCPTFYLMDTLRLGRAVSRCLKPEQFVVGCRTPNEALPQALQYPLTEYFTCPLHRVGYEQAEVAKMAINTYLIGALSFTNTLADLCTALGVEWSPVAEVLREDGRIGSQAYLDPGPGVHGQHIARDLNRLRQLGAYLGVDTTYLQALEQHHANRRSRQ